MWAETYLQQFKNRNWEFLLDIHFIQCIFGQSCFIWVKVNNQIVPHSCLFLGRYLPVWRRTKRSGDGRGFGPTRSLSTNRQRWWLLFVWRKAIQIVCKFVLFLRNLCDLKGELTWHISPANRLVLQCFIAVLQCFIEVLHCFRVHT